jgi:outer membrane protein OmpA-like peptidoglycan-associated protein
MNFKLTVTVLLTGFLHSLLFGQSETYFVKKALFSTDKYDEFSPVCYKNGIVYCTNRATTRVLNYSTEENKGFIKINFIDTSNISMQSPKFFSKKLNTRFNDGPVTFNSRGDTIFYSRNIITEGKLSEISSVRNKLGIFYATFDGNEWTKIKEIRINNEWYNVTTPWLSPDGKRLYFSSDKPGGYGGSDLYYCQWKNDYWDEPINLGPVINTKGNESYPFINSAGEFFFSSDGHNGLGGKDIFFSRFSDTSWIAPIGLDAPINSQHDDFGIYTDTLMNEGYFSSNRDKSVDIFQFKTSNPQIFYNSLQKENNYCFVFHDSGSIVVDTLNFQHKWSFGDGTSDAGTVVTHCFPGPGNYIIRLDLVEKETGRPFFTKLIDNLELRDYEQPFINSPDYVVKGDMVSFDGIKSYLPGFRILSYSWDFGDKIKSKGEEVKHSYIKNGTYSINLELVLKSETSRNIHKTGVSKKIEVFNSDQERSSFLANIAAEKESFTDAKETDNSVIKTSYSAEKEFQKDAVFCIELLTSKNKVDIKGAVFRSVPNIFTVRERFDPFNAIYSYTVDQQMNLMATYPTFRKMVALGFKDVKIKMFVLTDPSEKELHNLIRINGAFADSYFDFSDRLTSNAFIMLDQIVKLMNKYPSLRLEVAVHSDNSGSAETNLALSQKRSQLLIDYLINRGISARRLVATGYGGSKPIASNFLEKDRKLNRRIDFIIINK